MSDFERIHNRDVEKFITFAFPDIPEIKINDDIGQIIFESSGSLGGLVNRDIIVIASKIVSKSEGRVIDVSGIQISPEAIRISQLINKPPQVCQVILNESIEQTIRGSVIIAKHRLGYVLTSAGVDRVDGLIVSLIPENPDLSAQKIRKRIEELSKKEVAVIISDSEGREDRAGAGALALGASGINPLRIIERVNTNGKTVRTEETLSDLLASAANIIIGQRGKQTPVACIRGVNYQRDLKSGVLDILHF
jgi:coenzyme F420-0:L-glutamate ligase/coenzyme F420-1:gamma-L-glutamate ligase